MLDAVIWLIRLSMIFVTHDDFPYVRVKIDAGLKCWIILLRRFPPILQYLEVPRCRFRIIQSSLHVLCFPYYCLIGLLSGIYGFLTN